MHAERGESSLAERERRTEASVMRLLLSSEHGPWSRAELERDVAGVSGEPLDVADATNRLYAAGLIHLSGELVFPSLPARAHGRADRGSDLSGSSPPDAADAINRLYASKPVHLSGELVTPTRAAAHGRAERLRLTARQHRPATALLAADIERSERTGPRHIHVLWPLPA